MQYIAAGMSNRLDILSLSHLSYQHYIIFWFTLFHFKMFTEIDIQLKNLMYNIFGHDLFCGKQVIFDNIILYIRFSGSQNRINCNLSCLLLMINASKLLKISLFSSAQN